MLDHPAARFGLTIHNYRRFEHVIHAAVMAWPSPIEIDYTQSDLRYSTYIARLRDAIKYLRENHHVSSGGWLVSDLFPKLNTLEVRNHPYFPSKILVGDHESIKPPPSASNVGSPEVANLVARYALPLSAGVTQTLPIVGQSATSAPLIVTNSEPLKLSGSSDPDLLEMAVKAYATMASTGIKGLPKLNITKEGLNEEAQETLKLTIETYCDGFDVAVRDDPTCWVVF